MWQLEIGWIKYRVNVIIIIMMMGGSARPVLQIYVKRVLLLNVFLVSTSPWIVILSHVSVIKGTMKKSNHLKIYVKNALIDLLIALILIRELNALVKIRNLLVKIALACLGSIRILHQWIACLVNTLARNAMIHLV